MAYIILMGGKIQQGSTVDGECYCDLEICDILKEKKIDENLELHHKWIT